MLVSLVKNHECFETPKTDILSDFIDNIKVFWFSLLRKSGNFP